MSDPPYASAVEQGTQVFADLATQLYANRIPVPEPPLFSGNPMEYASWKSAFETLIEQKHIPPAERIHYLKRYLGGKARECIEGYFLYTSESSFADAKALLDKRFGNPYVLSSAFLDKLEAYPKVPDRDKAVLRKFSDFLRQCLAASKVIPGMSLNNPRDNMRIQEKLPDWVLRKWGNVIERHTNSGSFPSFEVFVDFLEDVANNANNPCIFSKTDKSGKGSKSQGSRHVFTTSSTEDGNAKKNQSPRQRQGNTQKKQRAETQAKKSDVKECIFCKGSHPLDLCGKFLEKSMDERKEFARKNRLCFACLKPNHISKKCTARAVCRTCSKRHPTAFHYERKPDAAATSEYFACEDTTELKSVVVHSVHNHGVSGSSSSIILPVYVSIGESSTDERLVYAILDPQSDACFITEHTSSELNASGPEVTVRLSTISTKDEIIHPEKISDIYVRGFSSSQKTKIPPAFTRPELPVNRAHIPTPETARMWPYLECIANDMVPLLDIEVGLLIGKDCTQLLVPRKVIDPQKDGPYGQKSDLGWGIIGGPGVYEEDISSCFRVSVEAGSNDQTARAKIEPRIEVKELFTPIDVAQSEDSTNAMDSDFKYSYNDAQFLKRMKSGIKQMNNGHYSMPLPLKRPVPKLPNNHGQALLRLNLLKKRFNRKKSLSQSSRKKSRFISIQKLKKM
jgi:hypothetical protein